MYESDRSSTAGAVERVIIWILFKITSGIYFSKSIFYVNNNMDILIFKHHFLQRIRQSKVIFFGMFDYR